MEGSQLADIDVNAGTAARPLRRKERAGEPTRVVLFCTRAGVVSESLIHALERELPWVVVEQVERVEEACAAFTHPVSLILVDVGLINAAEAASTELSILHPQALVAVMEPDDRIPVCLFSDIVGSRLVRGVLPMNLRLDLWLSVVRLMLRGGEYYPPVLVHSYVQKAQGEGSMSASGERTSEGMTGKAVMANLTPREIQILELVSRGLQNKTIAAAFRLSENTVKIHLHNIIGKLGAHNRTEAAARFRDLQANGSRI